LILYFLNRSNSLVGEGKFEGFSSFLTSNPREDILELPELLKGIPGFDPHLAKIRINTSLWISGEEKQRIVITENFHGKSRTDCFAYGDQETTARGCLIFTVKGSTFDPQSFILAKPLPFARTDSLLGVSVLKESEGYCIVNINQVVRPVFVVPTPEAGQFWENSFFRRYFQS